MAATKTTLSILQDHYPERLRVFIFINVPFLVTAFLKIIMSFADPVTREKVKFNPDIFEEGIFSPDMVMENWWGGSQDFDYVHEKYWPNLVELCGSRAKVWMKNWRDLGGKVGLKEWDYKQENVLPLAKHEETSEKEEIIVTIDTPGKAAEVLKLVPSNITADTVKSADHSIH